MSNRAELPPRGRSPSNGGTKGKKKPRRRWPRVLFAFFGVVILGLLLTAGYLYMKLDDTLDKVADPVVKDVPKEERAQVKPIAFALLGVDNRHETGSMNTDVMMVAAFNPKSKTATVVTIPRDSDLNLDGYARHKANGYYADFLAEARSKQGLKGDDAMRYARTKTKDMLAEFFGIPIDYAAVVDFQGFIDVVDALGGIEVYVDQDMKYWDTIDGTNIDLKKGEQTLHGEDALGFVRYRQSKNNATRASSDFERNERQGRVLGAIVDKLKTIGGATKVGGVLGAVGDNMKTDIPQKQIQNVISTYLGIGRDDIRFVPLTGKWKSPYVNLDDSSVTEAKSALAEELSSDGREASPATASAPSAE